MLRAYFVDIATARCRLTAGSDFLSAIFVRPLPWNRGFNYGSICCERNGGMQRPAVTPPRFSYRGTFF